MRYFLVLSVIILAQMTLAFAQKNPSVDQKKHADQLKGTWALCDWPDRDKDYNRYVGTLIFSANNRVKMIIQSDTVSGTFTYNTQKSPHWLDLNMKSDRGESVNLYGIIKWIDNETTRIDLVRKGVNERPAAFEDEPSLDKSACARKQMIVDNSFVLNDLTKGKWDIIRLVEANNHEPGQKYQTIKFESNNRFEIEGTVLIPGSSGKGRFELNTSKNPYWIDLYSDEGGKITRGLFKEHLNGYKLQLFSSYIDTKHPIQFSDVEYGMTADMIKFDPTFFYLVRSEILTKNSNPNGVPGKTENRGALPAIQTNTPKENSLLASISPFRVKASSIYPPDNSTYEPSFTIDNNTATAWFPQRTNKSNSGQWLKFEFPSLVTIKGIGIINGWAKNDNLWSLNSRVKNIRLQFSNGNEKKVLLKDTKNRQLIPFDETDVSWVLLTIIDCYTGSTVEAGLTEVDFMGIAEMNTISSSHTKREWNIVINNETGQITGRLEIEKMNGQVVGKFWNNKSKKYEKIENVGLWDTGLQFYHDGTNEFYRGEFKNGNINMTYYRMGSTYTWSASEVSRTDNSIEQAARNARLISKVSKLSSPINTASDEFLSQISADGKSLYFYRNILNDQKKYNQILYKSELLNSLWSNPIPVVFWRDKNVQISNVKFSADEQTIYFNQKGVSDAFGGSSWDIFTSVLDGLIWSEPRNLGTIVNSRFDDAQPTISADNKMIVFVSNRQGSIGGNDLWMSMKDENGNWGQPVNLGIWINTINSEWRPYFAPDCKTLYFSSMVDKSFHVFRTTYNGFVWTEKEDLGPEINKANFSQASFVIDASGNMGYFASTSIESGSPSNDIYQVILPKPFCSEPTQILSGVISDQLNGLPVAADIWVEDITTGELVYISHSNVKTGRYQVVLPSGRNYSISAQRAGFFFNSYRIDLPTGSIFKELTRDILLAPIKKGVGVPINNIFFETGKAVLSNDSRVELYKAIDLLKNNPDLKIEISGHTDNQGKLTSNQTLSEQRAQAVKNYLCNNGIDAGRLIAKGYGQTKPISDNSTPEGRQMNRRTEFVVIETGN